VPAHLASRAFLVRLGFADGDAVGGELEVTYIYAGEFRAPESSRNSGQNRSFVSKFQKALAPGGDGPPNVYGKELNLSVLRSANGLPNSLERLADYEVAVSGGRVGEACSLVRLVINVSLRAVVPDANVEARSAM